MKANTIYLLAGLGLAFYAGYKYYTYKQKLAEIDKKVGADKK